MKKNLMKRATILIIDDDPNILTATKMILKREFSTVQISDFPQREFQNMKRGQYDILLLDMAFKRGSENGAEGLEWLKRFRSLDSGMDIIMLTSYGDPGMPPKAIKAGAVDFLAKPWSEERLLTTVRNALALRRARSAQQRLEKIQSGLIREQLPGQDPLPGISESTQKLESEIERIATGDSNVLIQGESGSFKEWVAKRIHYLSGRRDSPFLCIETGTAESINLESGLFGTREGAFKDTSTDSLGSFELANTGTVYLDEIAGIPAELQKKLKAAIQNRRIVPRGAIRLVPVDIRLISATGRDITRMITKGEFDPELLKAVCAEEIQIPPLRDRMEDIPALAKFFLKKFTDKYGLTTGQVSEAGIRKLMDYSWPGNERELEMVLERAVILAGEGIIRENALIIKEMKEYTSGKYDVITLERDAISRALEASGGNISKAAELAGVSRSTFYRKVKKFGL